MEGEKREPNCVKEKLETEDSTEGRKKVRTTIFAHHNGESGNCGGILRGEGQGTEK